MRASTYVTSRDVLHDWLLPVRHSLIQKPHSIT